MVLIGILKTKKTFDDYQGIFYFIAIKPFIGILTSNFI